MKVTKKKSLVVACAICALLASFGQAAATEIWYQDNNLGKAGGMPADFLTKFEYPETFERATKYINVYMMSGVLLNKMDDAFFTNLLFPYLRRTNIKLAVNSAGATWAGANARREAAFEGEIDLLKRIKSLGGRVDYISLQSVLSKPWRQAGVEREFPLERRIAGVVSFARAAGEVFPQAAIGIIDALPAKGAQYKDAYRRLADAMTRENLKLSYIDLDVPFDLPKSGRNGVSWASLREVERFVEDDLHVGFGLFATSRAGGMRSSKLYFEGAVGTLDCFSGVGGTPRAYVVASWFPHPETTVPDTASGDNYPTMRVVREFGQHLQAIEKDPAWVAERGGDGAWKRNCGIQN